MVLLTTVTTVTAVTAVIHAPVMAAAVSKAASVAVSVTAALLVLAALELLLYGAESRTAQGSETDAARSRTRGNRPLVLAAGALTRRRLRLTVSVLRVVLGGAVAASGGTRSRARSGTHHDARGGEAVLGLVEDLAKEAT